MKSAIIVVDFQNDFCPPSGALSIPDAKAVIPLINTLLSLPFDLRIATRDFHPSNHVSFASNHLPPHNVPFESSVTVSNPLNVEERDTFRVWPDHCVQNTPGCSLVKELDAERIDRVFDKGRDERYEMYSAFGAPFSDPKIQTEGDELVRYLKENDVGRVYIVGLALDYCVKYTALDAVKNGFETYVLKEATRSIDAGKEAVEKNERVLKDGGVKVITSDGEEVKKIKEKK